MPYYFDFDSKNRILRSRWEGRVTEEAFKEYYLVVRGYIAQFDPLASIADLSAVTAVEIPATAIRAMAKMPPFFPNLDRPRVVIAPSPQIFGMARMFELQGQETRPNLHIVKTEKEAWAIVGVQQPRFEPLELK